MVGGCHGAGAGLTDVLGCQAAPGAVGEEEEEEEQTGRLAPRHRPWAPELLQTLWSDPHSNFGIFIYFDMICPSWAAVVQRDKGPRSPWFKALAGSYLFQAEAAATKQQQQQIFIAPIPRTLKKDYACFHYTSFLLDCRPGLK